MMRLLRPARGIRSEAGARHQEAETPATPTSMSRRHWTRRPPSSHAPRASSWHRRQGRPRLQPCSITASRRRAGDGGLVRHVAGDGESAGCCIRPARQLCPLPRPHQRTRRARPRPARPKARWAFWPMPWAAPATIATLPLKRSYIANLPRWIAGRSSLRGVDHLHRRRRAGAHVDRMAERCEGAAERGDGHDGIEWPGRRPDAADTH